MMDDVLKKALMDVLDQLVLESEQAHGQMLTKDLDGLGRDTKYDGGEQGLGEGLDIEQHRKQTKPDDEDEEENIKHN